MVQFLSINFFSWISSIFVGLFKSYRFFCVTPYLYKGADLHTWRLKNASVTQLNQALVQEFVQSGPSCKNLGQIYETRYCNGKLFLCVCVCAKNW